MNKAQIEHYTQESIERVNQARIRMGLSPLTIDKTLGQVAQTYSEAMASQGFYSHTDPQGREVGDRLHAAGYSARRSAENIARGQATPMLVVEGWLDSPGHRANIMHPELEFIGAGYAHTPTPNYYHYWTHVFATPDPGATRDRDRYVAEAQQLMDDARRAAGNAPLTHAPELAKIAREYLDMLAGGGAAQVRRRGRTVLNQAGQAALGSYRHAAAEIAAGRATPEEAVDEWERDGALLDKTWQAAGLAYGYADDDLRHYWLLVLAG